METVLESTDRTRWSIPTVAVKSCSITSVVMIMSQ